MNTSQQNFQHHVQFIPEPPMAPSPVPVSGLMISLAVFSWLFAGICLVAFMAYASMSTDGSRVDAMGVSIVQNQTAIGGVLAFLIGFLFIRLRRI